jgi:hypothetical protein
MYTRVSGQSNDMKLANRSFGTVEQFRYLETSETIQILLGGRNLARVYSGKASATIHFRNFRLSFCYLMS